MNPDQVADIFRFNMTALVVDADKRRQAKVANTVTDEPREPAPKQAA